MSGIYDDRWCLCGLPLYPDEPDGGPCWKCREAADDSRSDWTAA